jgi:hypothetical protein
VGPYTSQRQTTRKEVGTNPKNANGRAAVPSPIDIPPPMLEGCSSLEGKLTSLREPHREIVFKFEFLGE